MRPVKLVTDANVWIDLDNGGLTTVVFSLPHAFASPDTVVRELGPELGAELGALGLEVLETPPERQHEWVTLRARYRLPSDAGLHALPHARLLGTRLVTGDRDLRNATDAEGVQVSGQLWIMDELVDRALLSRRAAGHSLRQIRDDGVRLPADEVRKRLRAWR